MREEQLVITGEDGSEQLVEILFTHTANGKNYVVFEFSDTNEISAAIYTPDDNLESGTLSDIETEEEWNMLDEVLNDYFANLDDEEEATDLDDENGAF